MDLKERELEILKLMTNGLSNKEIAQQLFLAEQTVRWYNSQIYSKLGVKSRQEAVKQARLLGLFQTDKSVESIPHNLPAQTTPFVGRKKELAALTQLLEEKHIRLVTILAPGGMGKTRIALELSERFVRTRQADFNDGIFYVPLQPLSDPHHIVLQIAKSIGYQFIGDSQEPKEQLVEFLSHKRLFLLIDNWEHLLEGVSLITDILQAAPNVRILATSREKLNLSSETIFSLIGMDFPTWETPEDALEYGAVQLLVQSARRIKSDWGVTTDNLDYVARVCRLTEGMPLGIVLAVSWLDTLSLQDIVDEIQHSVDFLASEMRDMPERQQSIRAVFDYTWHKLSKTEQLVFMKLSVFRGGFTRRAAQAVADSKAHILQTLVNKALVIRDNEGKYDIHELLRQYAEEQLVAFDYANNIRDAHSQYYLNWLGKLGSDLRSSKQMEAISEFDSDFTNVRVAWEWAVNRQYFDWISPALEFPWFSINRTRLRDGLELYRLAEKASENKPDTQLFWARAIPNKILILAFTDPQVASQQKILARKALEIARAHRRQSYIAYAHLALGMIARLDAKYELAVDHYEKSHSHFREVNDIYLTSLTLHWLGHCIRYVEGVTKSISIFRKSLELRQIANDHSGYGYTVGALAFDLILAGNLIEADEMLQSQVGINDHMDLVFGIVRFMKGDYLDAKELALVGLQKAAEDNHVVTKTVPSSLLSLVYCIEKNYIDSVTIGKQIQSTMNFGTWMFLSDWILSLAYCGLEDFGAVRESTTAAVRFTNQIKGQGAMTWCLPPMASYLANSDQPERAIKILSLACNHPASTTGWLDQWSLIARLKDSLKDEVGPENYHALWEHGMQLDLYEIVAYWLADYS